MFINPICIFYIIHQNDKKVRRLETVEGKNDHLFWKYGIFFGDALYVYIYIYLKENVEWW